MYKIVRHYQRPGYGGHIEVTHRTIETGLSLDEVQSHCRDPETSSSTASRAKANRIRRSANCIEWFDGYTET